MTTMPNRLAREKSPYLLQHAKNPVDWYPWGEEAFTAARVRNVPIFLSIGYSTCHWCHVMERESFENENIARYLNEHFVAIKVDREERPDLDEVYMAALQALSGGGGWPMSVFLASDLKPFYAGTYFPPVAAYGRPSFLQLLERISELWRTEPATIAESSEALTSALRTEREQEGGQVALTDVEKCYAYFRQSFDAAEGGFGSAPKFPRPVQFDFLFEYWYSSGARQALDMALFTLTKMADGGIYDQIGGGFHRYSVDRFWRVSHFEKMLYDQAQLTNAYLDAYQITDDPKFARAAIGICDYVLRDLTSSEGGFFSAEDADSEGEEGKFYVWTKQEIESILGDRASVVLRRFGITESGNFEHGKNVLHVSESLEAIASDQGKSVSEIESTISSALATLYSFREGRVRPHLDDKILTSWNGLMIGAMARAGRVLDRPDFVNAASAAAEFLWSALRGDGQLYHRWRDGERAIAAMLDDYAFGISGFIALYEATLDGTWIHRALDLQHEQDACLWDEAHGGYFTTADSTDIIVRRKSEYDGAEPSGNSLSALNLLALAAIAEDETQRDRAELLIRSFSNVLNGYPYATPKLVVATMRLHAAAGQIILAGDDLGVEDLHRALADIYAPGVRVIAAKNAFGAFARSLAGSGRATAYYCRDFVCELPVHDADALRGLIDQHRPVKGDA